VDNKIYFTKVFKGYSPDEVESFIIKLNSEFQQKQQDFEAQTKRFNNEIAELKQRFEETIASNEKLSAENKQLKQDYAKIIEEKRSAAPTVSTPEKKNDAGDDGRDYKRLCEQMGEKLLVAEMRADEIIKQAQRKADDVLDHSSEKAAQEIQRVIEEAKKRAEGIYKSIESYEKKQVFISAGLDQARKHISDAISEVESLISARR